MRRDEDDTVVPAEYDVPGHDRGLADADRTVHASQHDRGRRERRVVAAHEADEAGELLDAVDVANGRVPESGWE